MTRRAARMRSLSDELGSVDLGDKRLNRRLRLVASALAAQPGASLPRACRTEAALEATYRLLSNPRVTPAAILEPHFEQTRERMNGEPALLAIHDTTEFAFGGEARASLGRTNNAKPGFFAHVTLGIRAGNREPVGVLACRTWARKKKPTPKKTRITSAYVKRTEKESNRWADAVREVEERYGNSASLIHVVDREGDQYRLLAAVLECGSRFIVRSHHDRTLVEEEGTAWAAVTAAKVVFEREVQLSRRRPKHKRAAHGPRDARVARLGIAAASIEVKRSWGPYNHDAPLSLETNIVRVFEIDPPEDEEPVEWMLLTNLPIDTEEQLAFIVDGYRARWTIEEFFKAVKTGCGYEKLQLENELALNNALAIILPIAWQMLLLRSLARTDDEAPARSVLTERQIEILGNTPWTTMPKRPTVRDAMRAVATLGGHIRNNGEPGWQVLYAGLRDLMLLEVGWSARSDQS